MSFVEIVERIGSTLLGIWALFEDESGDLTVLGSLGLAVLALIVAFRCARETWPALREELSSVLAVGSAITLVFVGVGTFFLGQAIVRVVQ